MKSDYSVVYYLTPFQVLISALVVVAAVATPVVKRINGVISVSDDDFAPEYYSAINRGDYHLPDSGGYDLIDAGERRNLVQRSPKPPKKLGKKAFFGVKKTIKNNKPGNLPGKTKGNKKVFKGTKKTLKATGKGTKAFSKGSKKACIKGGCKKLAKKGK